MKKTGTLLIGALAVTFAAAAFAACDSSAEYTVTFISGNQTVATVTAEEGGTVYSAYVETAEGVRFDGWYESETATAPFDFTTAITGNVTLYARFSSMTYGVVYDLGGASGTAPTQAGVNADGSFTVSENVPVREGYRFVGWTDGTNVYAAGDTYTVNNASDVVLVALWDYRDVTVTFLNDVGKTIYTSTVPYGSSVIAPVNVPHSSFAFRFVGWNGPSLYNVTEDSTYVAVYDYAPADDSYFTYKLNADKLGYTIAAKNASKLPEQLALPEQYNGLPVTEVATDGFSRASNTSAVYIPSSYRVLGGEAFYGSALEEVYIEEGLEVIGACAFQSLNGILTVFEIPASLKEIHTAAFQGLLPTESYEWLEAEERQKIDSFKFTLADGAKFVYNEDETLLTTADGKDLCFVSPSVTNLVIPATVETVQPALCMGYSKLKSVRIEGALKEIGGSAFKDCYALSSLTFANGAYVEKISGAESGERYEDGVALPSSSGAFFSCDLQNLVFPSGLKHIGAATFFWNPRIDTVVLPLTVEYISEQAFENYQYDLSNMSSVGKENLEIGGISSITFAGGATENDNYRIDGRSIVEIGTGANGGDKLLYFASASAGDSYTVPQGVTSAAPFCFHNAEFLRSLTLPQGLTELSYGFAMSSKIESVNIPASVESFSTTLASVDGTEEGTWGTVSMWGGYGTFLGCSNLKTITFGANGALRTLPANAFNGIGAVTLTIPDYITEIEGFAIYGENLQSISVAAGNTVYQSVDGVLFSKDGKTLILYPSGKTDETYTVPAGTVVIGSGAFNVCTYLEKVVISEGVTTLEMQAFNYCYYVEYDEETWEPIASSERGLKEVEFPATLERIGDYAFYNCQLLEKVTFKGLAPTLEVSEWSERSSFGTMDWDTWAYYPSENLVFVIPENDFKDYYLEFYRYNPNLVAALDVPESMLVTYHFDTNGGEPLEDVTGYMLTTFSVPVKNGSYFWGWYLQDGSQSGEWGDLVAFPFIGEGASVTFYARWENTRKQDGTLDIWAYELSDVPVNVTLQVSETVFFTVTPQKDCYFRLKGIPEGTYYEYGVYDESGEWVGYTGYFELQAGVTYFVYFICGGDEDGEADSITYAFLPAFYDEDENPIDSEEVLPSDEETA